MHLGDFILGQFRTLEPAQGRPGSHPGPETSNNSTYFVQGIPNQANILHKNPPTSRKVRLWKPSWNHLWKSHRNKQIPISCKSLRQCCCTKEFLKSTSPDSLKMSQMISQMYQFGRPLDHKITKSVSLRGIGFLHFFTSLFEGRVEKKLIPSWEPKYRNRVRGEPPQVFPSSLGQNLLNKTLAKYNFADNFYTIFDKN